MTRKRYIRLLMSAGYSRNDARQSARAIIRYNVIAGIRRNGDTRTYSQAWENRLGFVKSLIDYLREDVKTK